MASCLSVKEVRTVLISVGKYTTINVYRHKTFRKFYSITRRISNSEKIAKINVELEQLKGKDLNSLNHFKELEQFKHKNDELERENISLREINENLTSTLSELNIKLKAIESERMSLVTVIKILQSDQNLHQHESGDPSTQTTAKWNIKTSEYAKQSQKTGSYPIAKLPPGENTIPLNNRFNVILYLKFKMSNHKIVFLSRVVVILPSISFRK